jgi:hypothetical protein
MVVIAMFGGETGAGGKQLICFCVVRAVMNTEVLLAIM